MEPSKQAGDGPFDLNASNDPARRRDGSSSRQPSPSSLVEQTMPPPPPPLLLNPPQLLQQQPYPRPSVRNFTEDSYFAFPGLFPRANLQSHTFVNPEPPFANQLAPSSHQSMPSSSANGHHPGAAPDFSLWAPIPNASFDPYASHWASRPSSSANVPQPGAASAFSMGGLNASLHPYASHWTSMSSSSANVPQSGAASVFSMGGLYASLDPYASHWTSMASSSTNVPQPDAATAFSLGFPNAILDPNAFSGLTAPPARPTESQRLQSFSQGILESLDLPRQAFRANLLDAETSPALLTMSERVSARVASMLDHGDQGLRVWVIQAVSRDVHRVMGSEPGSAVFLALLRAVDAVGGEHSSQELRIIVEAAASHRDRSLMSVANSEAGKNALKELFRLVAKNGGLCRQLFNCLVDGWRMDQSNGPELLQYLFTELGYFYCSIFINRLALPRFTDMVKSEFGRSCMLLCLQNAMSDAKDTDYLSLKEVILSYTVVIAKRRYDNLFLQEILMGDYDDILIKNPIRSRVEQDLQELSTDPLGSNVVEACYVPDPKEPELRLLQRGLDAFLALTETQLVELVPDPFASRVLCNLLGIGKDIEPLSAWARSMKLARRIEKVLGAAHQGDPVAREVMKVVREVLSRQQQGR